MTRLHARTLELVARTMPPMRDAPRWRLACPAPGWFRPYAVRSNSMVYPGDALGELAVLGRTSLLVLPPNVWGSCTPLGRGSDEDIREQVAEARAVACGDTIAMIDAGGPMLATGGAAAAAMLLDATRETGRVFRAPTSGRFYGRASPDKPAFVATGDVLQQGATICLLEVMKTFHRVTYTGEPATVKTVLVAEGADVNQGDALLALE